MTWLKVFLHLCFSSGYYKSLLATAPLLCVPGVVQQDKSYLADIFLTLMTWLQMTKDKKPHGFNIQIRGIKIQMQFHRHRHWWRLSARVFRALLLSFCWNSNDLDFREKCQKQRNSTEREESQIQYIKPFRSNKSYSMLSWFCIFLWTCVLYCMQQILAVFIIIVCFSLFFLHGSVPQTYKSCVQKLIIHLEASVHWSFEASLWPWNLILALWASMIKVTKLLDKCSQCRRVHCESMPDIKLNLIFPPLVTVSEFLDVSQQDFWSKGLTPSCDWTEPGISLLSV